MFLSCKSYVWRFVCIQRPILLVLKSFLVICSYFVEAVWTQAKLKISTLLHFLARKLVQWYKVNANIFYYFCLFKPKFLLIPFRISHFYGWKQQKTNQNLQYDNRSTLTTGKVSADFSWFFISNGGVLGSCYCLVSTHWISINVILSHFKNVK